MAAAQARAAWQRIANRILVQDDPKRAPKFTTFSPSVLLPRSDSDLTSCLHESCQPVLDRSSLNSSYPIGRKLDPQKIFLRENMETRPKETAALDVDDALNANLEGEGKKETRGKVEPWWRLVGKEELTLFLVQKVSDKVENCDLPRPQTVQFYDDLPSKNEVLGALRLSQTRAREAETAAQEARREKERVIRLIFKQASTAYALRLWIQMLQVERLLLRRRIEGEQVFFPAKHRAREGAAFAPWRALGLIILGAGVLLGWLFSSPF